MNITALICLCSCFRKCQESTLTCACLRPGPCPTLRRRDELPLNNGRTRLATACSVCKIPRGHTCHLVRAQLPSRPVRATSYALLPPKGKTARSEKASEGTFLNLFPVGCSTGVGGVASIPSPTCCLALLFSQRQVLLKRSHPHLSGIVCDSFCITTS